MRSVSPNRQSVPELDREICLRLSGDIIVQLISLVGCYGHHGDDAIVSVRI